MSDAFGASVHQPDPGMLQRVIEYLRGRTAAASPDLSAKDQLQQALAAQQVYGGPQGRPFGGPPATQPIMAAMQAVPTQPVQTQPLPPPSTPPSQPQHLFPPSAINAANSQMTTTGPLPSNPGDVPIPPQLASQPPDVSPAVVAYAGGGAAPITPYDQRAPIPASAPITPYDQRAPVPQGTPSATPSAAGAGRDVTVNKKSPWGPQSAPNQDVIGARGGPLSDRKMGMFDLSSLFGGGNGNG